MNFYRLMRISILTTIFCTTITGLIYAADVRAQDISTEQVTIELQHENLESAIRKMQSQTTLHFYYRQADIAQLNNLYLNKQTLSIAQALNTLLVNTFLTYRQSGGHVFIERISQENYEVSGLVLDNKHQPMQFVTVRLFKENHLLQGTQTDTAGHYKLQIAEKGTISFENIFRRHG